MSLSLAQGCEFGLCQREAELLVTPSPIVEALKVCGLHVTPVLSWGVIPDANPVIEFLRPRPEAGRAA